MDEKYFPEKIEEKWQRVWAETGAFEAEPGEDAEARPKFFCLEMMSYPSGFLHMGHVRSYCIGDALAWHKRLQGFNVLHPFGWDGFGQPADEEAATTPDAQARERTEENIAQVRGQLKRLGIGFDWGRETATHRPDFYKWNQWFFLKMLERGLIYRRTLPVNWCPKDETVLPNEQTQGGVCLRCGTAAEKRERGQWFIRTTVYAEELLADMKEIEAGWPDGVLAMQRNRIGRSVGAYVDFPVRDSEAKVRVFTTRIDTIYGATFIVVAPEHPLLNELEESPLKERVMAFVARVKAERAGRAPNAPGEEEKAGVNTGLFAVNPFNGEQMPVWVANYVRIEYGAGAVMAVPAHDGRDFEFAQKYSLPVHRVIERISHEQESIPHTDAAGLDQSVAMPRAFTEFGILVNSAEWGGKLSQDAIREMAAYAQEKGFGGGAVTYRMRDWNISSLCFRGAPVPVVYCDECGIVPVPEQDLPVVLPERVEFKGAGESPPANIADFVNTSCPRCERAARRETDTMDAFVGSSWHFFRYCDPANDAAPFDKARAAYWTPVDQYIGGTEHALTHLLYARFWTKMMRDIGLVTFDEPVRNLLTPGAVTNIVESTGEWKVMSKPLGNDVDPGEMIESFGADALRLSVIFAAPPENELRWSETGIEGAERFLRRVYNFAWRWHAALKEWGELTTAEHIPSDSSGVTSGYSVFEINKADFSDAARALERKTHQTIARITQDFEELRFNTSIAALMELSNALGDFKVAPDAATEADKIVVREALEALVLMLAPFAPHVAEEMWESLGHTAGGLLAGGALWPQAIAELARKEALEIPVQINGKLRGRIQAAPDTPEDELREAALADEKVRAHMEGREVVKVIVVPQRLVNIVAR